MRSVIVSLLVTLRASLRNRAALQLEILARRHQLNVVTRSRPRRLRLTQADRLLWVWLSRVWNEWRSAVVIVKPETVLAWHRRGFRSSGPGKADTAWVDRLSRWTSVC
jgi:putative transposase